MHGGVFVFECSSSICALGLHWVLLRFSVVQAGFLIQRSDIDVMYLGLTPVSAITLSGFQLAELLVCLAFLFELLMIRSLRAYIFWISLIICGVVVGGMSVSAFSQVIKLLLIPMVALRFSGYTNGCQRLRFAEHKAISNVNVVIVFLCLISVILNLRISDRYYVDATSGIFRHSVDFAFFVLVAFLSLSYQRKFALISFIMLAIPAVFLGGSRTLLILLPMFILLSRPLLGTSAIALGFFSFYHFDAVLLPLLSDKVRNIVTILISLDFTSIIDDSSLAVRARNFAVIFSEMELRDWLVGLPRTDILRLTSEASSGDVSTDNFILYKIVFFGLPFGLFSISLTLFGIYLVSNSKTFVFVLVCFGMLQDWLSNAFCIFMLYITFLAARQPVINKESHFGIGASVTN